MNNKKIQKLLFILNIDYFLISHRLPIAIKAEKQGYEVHIAAKNTGYLESFKKYKFKVHPIEIERTSMSFVSLIRTFFSIKKIYKEIKPDIVHLISIKPILIGGFAMHFINLNPKIIISISGLGYIYSAIGKTALLRKKLVNQLYKFALNHRKITIIFQNISDKNDILAILPRRDINSFLIHGSGVNLKEYKLSPLPKGKPIILFPARIVISKGIYEFVNAAKILKDKARFVIAGEIDFQSRDFISEDILNRWISENIIEHWGFSKNMANTIRKSTMVVLPSYREGLPKVICEAAAIGRPVVTSDVPGCRDSIINNKTGLLVPVRDSQKLSQAILYLLENRKIINKMCLEANLLAKRKFDVDKVVQEHLSIYNKFI